MRALYTFTQKLVGLYKMFHCGACLYSGTTFTHQADSSILIACQVLNHHGWLVNAILETLGQHEQRLRKIP